jgi:hypothetical protein
MEKENARMSMGKIVNGGPKLIQNHERQITNK